MDKPIDWREDFLQNAEFRMRESLRMIAISLSKMEEEDIWKRPNAQSNSVGNLLLHLCGNIRQYGVSSIGRTKDVRHRDEEFAATSGVEKKELFARLEAVVNESLTTMRAADAADLLEQRSVQGFEFSGVGIIIHVVEHLSYHTGQIAYWTKILKGSDLGFYDGIDLNIKNEP